MGGIKGRKKWDNCNSTINKIYLKKEISIVFIHAGVLEGHWGETKWMGCLLHSVLYVKIHQALHLCTFLIQKV